MNPFRLQIQAVLYQTPKEGLFRCLEMLASAVQNDRKHEKLLKDVTVVWGDASEKPLFSESEIADWNGKFEGLFLLQYRFFNENTGYGKGHNLLAENAQSDLLMVMNPDILVCPDFFSVMIPPFEAPEIGLTEARQTPIEHPKKYNPKTLETDWASGACFLMPTALFQELEGFDSQSFFMYSEDVDLSLRIRLKGKKLLYLPKAPVYHAKQLDADGILAHTECELRFSPEANLVLAYKWRQKEQLRRLISVYQKGDSYQKAALKAFQKRVSAGEIRRISGDVSIFPRTDFSVRFSL